MDNKGRGLTIFTDKVYRKLNRSQELALQNVRNINQKISDIAEEAGITGGIQAVENMLNSKLGYNKKGYNEYQNFYIKRKM